MSVNLNLSLFNLISPPNVEPPPSGEQTPLPGSLDLPLHIGPVTSSGSEENREKVIQHIVLPALDGSIKMFVASTGRLLAYWRNLKSSPVNKDLYVKAQQSGLASTEDAGDDAVRYLEAYDNGDLKLDEGEIKKAKRALKRAAKDPGSKFNKTPRCNALGFPTQRALEGRIYFKAALDFLLEKGFKLIESQQVISKNHKTRTSAMFVRHGCHWNTYYQMTFKKEGKDYRVLVPSRANVEMTSYESGSFDAYLLIKTMDNAEPGKLNPPAYNKKAGALYREFEPRIDQIDASLRKEK